jgi:hypothetical protein
MNVNGICQRGYFGTGIVAAMAAQDFDDRCMLAHRWTKTRQKWPTPQAPPRGSADAATDLTGWIGSEESRGRHPDRGAERST